MMIKTRASGLLLLTLISGCQSTLPDRTASTTDSPITSKTQGQTTSTHPQNIVKSMDTANNTAIDAAITVTPAVLAAYHWSLIRATDRQQQPLHALMTVNGQGKQAASLHFEHSGGQNIINFGVGCNGMGGTYTLDENVLETARLMGTVMMCSEDVNQAENLLAKAMQGRSVVSFKVNEDDDTAQLTQQTANGDILLWQGSKTPEATYGQTPEMVFWEIKAQQPQCPDITLSNCLSVRPVYYDAQGIKTGVGDWQLFVDNIAGYTHDKGVNRIVRLKRFVTNPIDIKGKQYVYVLDNVIESSQVE